MVPAAARASPLLCAARLPRQVLRLRTHRPRLLRRHDLRGGLPPLGEARQHLDRLVDSRRAQRRPVRPAEPRHHAKRAHLLRRRSLVRAAGHHAAGDPDGERQPRPHRADGPAGHQVRGRLSAGGPAAAPALAALPRLAVHRLAGQPAHRPLPRDARAGHPLGGDQPVGARRLPRRPAALPLSRGAAPLPRPRRTQHAAHSLRGRRGGCLPAALPRLAHHRAAPRRARLHPRRHQQPVRRRHAPLPRRGAPQDVGGAPVHPAAPLAREGGRGGSHRHAAAAPRRARRTRRLPHALLLLLPPRRRGRRRGGAAPAPVAAGATAKVVAAQGVELGERAGRPLDGGVAPLGRALPRLARPPRGALGRSAVAAAAAADLDARRCVARAEDGAPDALPRGILAEEGRRRRPQLGGVEELRQLMDPSLSAGRWGGRPLRSSPSSLAPALVCALMAASSRPRSLHRTHVHALLCPIPDPAHALSPPRRASPPSHVLASLGRSPRLSCGPRGLS
mmetsp:Transcript_41619/g.134949  ORF Transcript_41619/g.134949 Transcript_41619/m.134949 type:complete len:506 (+) Transcript_41619:1242-2759(+)